MSDFKWDDYKKEDDKHFDWGQFESEPKTSGGSALARGLEQGSTFGFFDELSGAGEAAGRAVGLKGFGGPISDIEFESPTLDLGTLKDAYRSRRDIVRGATDQARKDRPGTVMMGELGGGLATGIAAPIRAATTVPGMIKVGAALGGTAGLGTSDSDSVGGMALDTAIGAGAGAAGGAAIGGASNLLKKIPSFSEKASGGLNDFAEKRAFKALGGLKKANDKAHKLGNLNQIGRELLDEGVVTPLASKETMAKRVSDLVGKRVGELDDLLTASSANQAKFQPRDAAQALKGQLRAEYPDLPDSVLKSYDDIFDQWLAGGPKTIKELQGFKTQMQRFINKNSYAKDQVGSQDALKMVRRTAKEGIEKMADDFSSGAGSQVKGTNQKLGYGLQAEDILQDRISRDSANRSISLTDYLAGAGAASLGDPTSLVGLAKAAAGAATNKLGREYGNNIMAVGADKLSKMLMQSPRMAELAQKNPAAFRALVSDMAARTSRLRNSGGAGGSGVAQSDQKSGFDQENVPQPEAIDRYISGN